MKKGIFLVFLVVFIGLAFSPVIWAEVGVTDTEIVLGTQMDLSGPAVGFCAPLKNAMLMQVEEVNQAGGIHGRKIRLVMDDNAYDPKKAVMAMNKQITRDSIFSAVGIFGTPTALSCLPITTRKKIPALFPVSASGRFHTPFNRYSFILYASYTVQGRNIAKYWVENKKYKKIGLMYQDDEFGSEVRNGINTQLATYGLKLIAAEPYKRGATDFSSQIAKLKKADVQVVLLATVIRETVGALKEIRKIGWKVDVCTSSAAATHYVPILCMKSGFSADGTYALSSYPDSTSPDLPSAKEWAGKYKQKFGSPPQMTGYIGFDAIYFFRIAADRAGRDLTREKLIDALETFRNVPHPLGGSPITFSSKSHLGTKSYFMSQWKGMKLNQISDWISYEE